MAQSTESGRFAELDALRGLAALGVMTFHFFLFWKWVGGPLPAWAELLSVCSPLHIVLTGRTTVFFFVLSGLVLTFPYFAGRPPAYLAYLVKRVLRIYVPYLVAVAFALSLMTGATQAGGAAPPRATFAGMWAVPITWDVVLNHVLLIGSYNVYAINGVIWSLVHEMRISLIIPLIVWCVYRYSWRTNVAVGLGLSLAGNALHMFIHSPNLALYKTLPILLMFVVGALLSRNLRPILGWYRALPRGRKIGFSATALLLFTYSALALRYVATTVLTYLPAKVQPLHHVIALVGDWTTILGVAGLIVTVLGSHQVSAVMRARVLARLGEIPYGLYLYHLPILFCLYYILGDRLPLWTLYATTMALTYVLARLSRNAIELPAAALAQRLTSRLRRREAVELADAA